jgi:hypothetical protein
MTIGFRSARAVTTADAHLRTLHHDYHTSGCLRTAGGNADRTVVYKSPVCWQAREQRSPLWGSNLFFLGFALDGLTLGYQANVLSSVASSGQGHLALGVEGMQNPACQ